MASLERVINSPEQKTAEFWQAAYEVFTEYPELLERKTSLDGEEQFLVTPDFQPISRLNLKSNTVQAAQPDNEEEKLVLEQTYALAARVNRNKSFTSGSPLYLIINGNINSPMLQFDRTVSRLMVLDGSYESIENNDQTISKILGYITRGMYAKQYELDLRRESKSDKRKAIATALFGLLAVGGITGGVIKWRVDTSNDAEAARDAFDAQEVVLPGSPITAGDIAYVPTNLTFFDNQSVPTYRDGEDLESPRQFTTDDDDCYTVTTINPDTEALRAVTEAPSELAFIAISAAGEVKLCAFEPGDIDYDISTYPVAVQVVEREESSVGS